LRTQKKKPIKPGDETVGPARGRGKCSIIAVAEIAM